MNGNFALKPTGFAMYELSFFRTAFNKLLQEILITANVVTCE